MIYAIFIYLVVAYLLSFKQKQLWSLLLIPVIFFFGVNLAGIALALIASFLIDRRILSLFIFLGIGLFISFLGLIAFLGWEIATISFFILVREKNNVAGNVTLLFTQIGSAFLLMLLLSNVYGLNSSVYLYGFLMFEQALFPLQLWQLFVYRNIDWKLIAISASILSKVPAILISSLSMYFIYFLFFSAIIGFIAANYINDERSTIALLSSSSAAIMDFLLIYARSQYVVLAFMISTLALVSVFFDKKGNGEYNSLIYQGIPGSPIFPAFVLAFSSISFQYAILVLITLGIEVIPISKLFWKIRSNNYGNNLSKLLLAISIASMAFII